MPAYYNEIDSFAAAWLRELIKADHIAPGDVDERDIRDVTANDVSAYDQCHWFGGIGGWSYALRLAGWPDDRPVWTGSCPCQPFSAAGKRGGVDDERHLWPDWFWLIEQSRPDIIFGEQVASKDGLAWLDLVSSDLEGAGYAVGALDLCAASVGAPHIRQRLWFVGDSRCQDGKRRTPHGFERSDSSEGAEQCTHPGIGSAVGSMADASSQRRQQDTRGPSGNEETDGRTGRDGSEQNCDHQPTGDGKDGMADAQHNDQRPNEQGREAEGRATDRGIGALAHTRGGERCLGTAIHPRSRRSQQAEMVNPWADCDWLPCRDGKARPVESGTSPLAYGVSGRVGRLRGYGNAIVPQVAAEFIKAYWEEL